jgi:sugar-specific transcriptional regulator TrmB
VVDSLQRLGLSLYEAKLCVGLLKFGAQNGNELSRNTGVPSSKVYSTLDKLTAAGIVNQVNHGSTAEYMCIGPAEFLRVLRERYAQPLALLETTLPSLATEAHAVEIVQMSTLRAIADHALGVVASAHEEIFVSAWDDALDWLRPALVEAEGRGVRVFAMVYGETALGIGSWQRHSYRETVASRIGGRMLTLVADGAESLIAHMPESGEATGVLTQNPVICLVTEEYLRHDFILQRAKTMTGYHEWDAWLQANDDVHAVLLGRTGRESPIDPMASAEALAHDS